MDFTRVNRSELVGATKSKSAVVEKLICSNALNLTGTTNYNAGGVKDGVGFNKVTEKFVDNFLLRVLVPDYNIKNGRNIFIGSQNRTIRELLDAHGLTKCNVKAVAFSKLNESEPPQDMLVRMSHRNIDKKANCYFYQEYKIACPNLAYNDVMDFIRNVDYNGIGFFLKDIDVTIDYAGSFDKYEVIDHLTAKEGFREQGTEGDALRTIVNNDSMVGKNCLTFMETIDGLTTRQKIYNKMVQMLECKSVRSKTGCHWKDWICQTGTRLAKARDGAKDRGLTRAEVSFYSDSTIPSDHFIDDILQNILTYVPKSLVYSTSYSATWKAYCDTFKHSLVCIDRTEDIGIIAYSYNEITGNVSGQVLEKWSEREKWCLDRLILNGNLPLDVIEATEVSKTFSGKEKDTVLEICGNRYYKINKDSSTKFPTRLVSKGGVYSCNNGTTEYNAKLLEDGGFVSHENCIPYLAKSKGTTTSKADAELRKVAVLDVNVYSRKTTKNLDTDIKEKLLGQAKEIEERRKPLFLELQQKEEEITRIKEYKKDFCGCGTAPIRNLNQGSYTVKAAKKQETRFGPSYRLLIEDESNNYIVWSNKYITNKFEEMLRNELVNLGGNFISLDNQPLGTLLINGKGTNQYGNVSVYCTFVLNIAGKAEQIEASPYSITKTPSLDIPTITRENLLPYREYDNLTVLPVETIYKLFAVGYITHYGTSRLVVKIEENIYQAGQDLEEKVDKLTLGCSIKIEKIRTDRDRHIKYAICSIYEKGDWTSMVDYTKTSMLSKFDGNTCIVDVRSVDVKGSKRKLLLTNAGDVYKLKKSKLEETITPGFI